MSQMARVFSKLASPHEARVVSLGSQNISECHLILRPEVVAVILSKSLISDSGQKYVPSGESVLEAGKSK